MEDNLITTKEVGDYRIKVYYCRDSECPITNWGLFGSFFFEYSDMHRLHDECNWKTFFYDNKHNLRDVIDAIVMKHIKQKDIVEYALEIDEIVRRDVESCQGDWFGIDREIFMQPENKNKIFILGTRKTGCDLIILGGTNCDEGSMDWLFGSLGNENFYVCKPLSFYKSQREIQKVNPLYAFKVATAYFREQGMILVFEDANCKLIKL